MAELVDLKAAPYSLDEDQVAWVEETLAGLSLDEQVGQLFTNLFFFGDDAFSGNPYTAEQIIEKFHVGIARYHGGTSDQVQALLNRLQQASKVPLLIAANCDSGGNGAMKDGTYIASGAQTEATGSVEVARNAGYVSGREMHAIGANLNFDPCVDILENWRNTIVNTRAYGTTADDVLRYTIPFVEGQRESGILTAIKHFPGDGTEERDQHLVLGVNELSPERWDETFGRVYQAHIANGVEMIMAGHIALPYYSQKLNPALSDAEIMPATLAPELLTGLLKTQLGFNGAVITDASHMLGMTSAMRREDYVPLSIAAGCDAFLFFNNLEEDFAFMKAGVEKGVITQERLDDANRRILGLKAKLRLHEKKASGTLLRTPADLEVVGCEEHLRMQAEAADLGITLVKNTLDQLPLNPTDHRRVRIYHLTGEVGGITGGGEADMLDLYVRLLTERGYEVTINDGTTRVKGPTLKYRDEVDAALILAEVIGYGAQNNYRIQWKTAMSNECPWYVWEVPTFMVSHNFTTHLHDATMVKAYINAYHPNEANVRATLDKLEGRSQFKGTPNDLVWTEKWQAKL
ncbi:glycoside hydrolase family 3 protein [Aestuariimicrobium sp. T2.26MG-19.2B]|uniref:glycoside hydrolase family 3 protein n=1 Tax=Aestuariimicrobium sp. T2.26MG-19.2B TaxID=3040679 RepID=UPI0024776E54|nr:glycoside hydrolase family 3 N-terminal domain-containing protein [Aestuariimicrobium sp. T2.26MG-19.2B]CAI9402885.1 Beta-N-acetylglucosaminidase/beta-glucosidase [Aestuariimicrobium sp. T2.26MG-19.2B]